ncbi:hypothetical protein J2Z44_003526 [Clostridium punense]|uniref:Uncharacterized protein n=1 Tax=Clostridium punense TaxID=1054297 RepID=A0ABS4K7B4_9CLOT|nr:MULTISPECIES: hypothetical protein [Clostridium]EQB87230.1 hypothetical protein M918_10265 [Clostridium sp. BL8]MBP2023684.1 hypothetical protein [Clostridium punense]
MNIVNENVNHSVFGTGTIIELKDNKISVQFQESFGTKVFLYPDAFESFLKVSNPIVEQEILQELKVKQQREEVLKEKQRKEQELREKMEKLNPPKKKRVKRT